MIVVQTYTEEAGEGLMGYTSAVDFESLKRRLRLYFKNIGEIKARIFNGEVIDIPFVILQKDRRIRDTKVNNERRLK